MQLCKVFAAGPRTDPAGTFTRIGLRSTQDHSLPVLRLKIKPEAGRFHFIGDDSIWARMFPFKIGTFSFERAASWLAWHEAPRLMLASHALHGSDRIVNALRA